MATPRTPQISSEFLDQVLHGQALMLCDGGMGTLIQQAGLSGVHELPDLLNLTHASDICALQRRYVEAGSDCIATNTFSSNRLKLAGCDASVDELFAAAAAIAREAGAPLVAGDIGPTGSLLAPLGPLGFDEAYDIFAEQARAAYAAGCDLIFLETFADLLEAKAALLACLENTPLPVFVTMTFGEDGRTFMGTTPAIAAATLSALGASAVGLNCSLGPLETAPLAAQMAPHARSPLMVQPNAGLPRVAEDGSTVYDVGPQAFAQAMGGILDAGARIIGGCCGTTPEHIAALRRLLDEGNWLHDISRDYRPSFVVTSAQELVELAPDEGHIAVIGERINPTGKPRLKDALLNGNYDLLVAEAVAQVEAGANILDVNVGVPGIDEPAALSAVTERLQSTVPAPLQLDSSDPHALEAACR
ncbi:MAG: homocysteine S-methyltransferase family protein, partial [Bacteroidales bacterium]